MKKVTIIFLFAVAFQVFDVFAALSTATYFKSALTDKNEALTQAIITALPDTQKAGAIKQFTTVFGKAPTLASAVAPQKLEDILKQASTYLQGQLQGKSLNNEKDLSEVMIALGKPEGSGGQLAQQIKKSLKDQGATTAVINVLATQMVESAKAA